MQSVFQRVKGVIATTVGYSGGSAETANYRTVCSEDTGHAEAIEIVFDPAIVSYGTLLRVFFSVVHDPTQLNRQGADVGTSYRSAIFYTNEEQRKVAEAYIQQLDAAHVFAKPIVTQIVPLEAFYRGEDYHQDYAIKNPHNPYIQVCDIPKIAALGAAVPRTLSRIYAAKRYSLNHPSSPCLDIEASNLARLKPAKTGNQATAPQCASGTDRTLNDDSSLPLALAPCARSLRLAAVQSSQPCSASPPADLRTAAPNTASSASRPQRRHERPHQPGPRPARTTTPPPSPPAPAKRPPATPSCKLGPLDPSTPPTDLPKDRPVIGLALGGGGAVAMSEIGVLQWFEEHHIPVDVIAGTSMGSILAALYSTGHTPEQMKHIMTEDSVNSVFRIQQAYTAQNFRRRED